VRRAAAALLGTALLGVAGCLAGPAPADHFYRLEAAGAPAPLAEPALPGVLEVRPFRAEALTSERAILYRAEADAREVHRHAYHRWVETPPDMLQQLVADHLRRAGAAERVVTPALRVPADYELVGRIGRLEQVFGAGGPRVVLELDLAVTRIAADRELLLQEVYRAERATEGESAEAAARALGDALAEVLDRLVRDLDSL